MGLYRAVDLVDDVFCSSDISLTQSVSVEYF